MKGINKESVRNFFRNCLLYLLACSIPALLALEGFQVKRYADLENEVESLDETQVELIEKNKQLITDISLLSSSERIESIAVNELMMHKASVDEIVRIEVNGN